MGRFAGTVSEGADGFTVSIVSGRIPDFFSGDEGARFTPAVWLRGAQVVITRPGLPEEVGTGYVLTTAPPAGCDP